MAVLKANGRLTILSQIREYFTIKTNAMKRILNTFTSLIHKCLVVQFLKTCYFGHGFDSVLVRSVIELMKLF